MSSGPTSRAAGASAGVNAGKDERASFRDARALVIFDFDGTLVDTLDDIVVALNRGRAELGLAPASRDEVRSWIGYGVQQLIESALPPDRRDESTRRDLLGRYRRHYDVICMDQARVYPGIRETLDALAGWPLAVVSNKTQYFVDKMLRALELDRHFALALGGDTLAFKKPDPQVVRHVARTLGVEGLPVIVVGDSDVDMDTASNAGAYGVGCAWGLRGPDVLRRHGARVVLDDAHALVAAITDAAAG